MLATMLTMLGNPFVAAALGLALAAALLYASRASWRLMTPEQPGAGMALAALSLFGRMAGATVVLWAYKTYAPSGFKPFALIFASGFLILYTVELVRFAGLHRYRRPTGVRS